MEIKFGNILKHWRDIRRFSQMSLSNETGMSSRHISFLETGRAKPSRQSVLTLARVLEIPKPVVNDALLAAGLAPEYPAFSAGDINLKPMIDAMNDMLNNHAPLPAIIIDGNWQIVGGNVPAMHMVQFLPFHGSMCVVNALINDDPENPIFQNWEEIAAWTLTRLQLETSRHGGDSPLKEIYQKLASDPRYQNGPPSLGSDRQPYLQMKARINGQDLSFFTMLAEFTSAQDIAMSERRIELFFASDEVTRLYFENLAETFSNA